jgi:predicted ArsR family transcriptional regulator
MGLDDGCRRIASLLYQGGKAEYRTLGKLIKSSGFARSTLMLHLKHLQDQGMTEKEEVFLGKVGRPTMHYRPSAKLIEAMKGSQAGPRPLDIEESPTDDM